MAVFPVILVALGLSADCFAVALAASTSNKDHPPGRILKVAASFGLFQSVMPVIGWLAGRTVVSFIAAFDHWLAFSLLAFVGGKMLWEAFHKEEEKETKDISRSWLLVTLSIATSLDALAVGLAFAFEDVNIWLASPVIGLTAFLVSGAAFWVGKKARGLLGKWAEVLGGLILIGIGIRILVEHLGG